MKHFTATGIVRDGNGRVLMIRHKKFGVWLPPGGHVERDELPDEAVLREIYEETGVRARLIEDMRLSRFEEAGCFLATPFLVVREDIQGDGSHIHIDLLYLCQASEEALKQNPEETTGIGWFTASEAMGLRTFDNVRQTLSLALEQGFIR